MAVEATESDEPFSSLEERFADLFGKKETTIHEDRILLLSIDLVANHCKRALAAMEAHQHEDSNDGNENTDIGGTPSFQEQESNASSTTESTGSEKRIHASASIAALGSQGSLSVLEARQLFTGKPSPEGSIGQQAVLEAPPRGITAHDASSHVSTKQPIHSLLIIQT